MNLLERFKQWRDGEAEKLRGMTLAKKAGYLFTYYKGWFLGFLVLLLFLGYVGDIIVQGGKEVVLQGFFTNDEYDLFSAQQLQKDVGAYFQLERNQRVIFDDNLYVDLHGEATEYSAASNGKIVAYVTTSQLDFVVTSREVFEFFARDLPLMDLSQLLTGDLLDGLAPDLIPAEDENGAVISGALDLSGSRFLQADGLEDADYCLFVPRRAPHPEAVLAFIRYCYGAE